MAAKIDRNRNAELRVRFSSMSVTQLRELCEEISDPADPRGDDTTYVHALHVALRKWNPGRFRW